MQNDTIFKVSLKYVFFSFCVASFPQLLCQGLPEHGEHGTSILHGFVLVTQRLLHVFVVHFPQPIPLLQGLPENGERGTVILYGYMLVTLGLLKTWAAPACNNPIFAEIVPPHLRNMIYAFDRCFEGAIAACAAPLVGLLAERMFGFTVSMCLISHT